MKRGDFEFHTANYRRRQVQTRKRSSWCMMQLESLSEYVRSFYQLSRYDIATLIMEFGKSLIRFNPPGILCYCKVQSIQEISQKNWR